MADVRLSKKEDIKYLYDKLKQTDIEELKILGYTPSSALDNCFLYSKECYTIFSNKKPIGIFGISKPEQNAVKIGLLTTPEIEKIKFQLIRDARKYIKSTLKNYKCVYNIVHGKNSTSIRFLKSLDFNFFSCIFINQEKFILFKKEL